MPVFQKPQNFTEAFFRQSHTPVIINDLADNSVVDREYINDLISTRYSSDMVSLLPSCRCKHTKGESSKLLRCPKCGTYVKSTIESDIEALIWFRRPGVGQQQVAPLINPIFWTLLRNRFRSSTKNKNKPSSCNIIQWLTDTSYEGGRDSALVRKLIDAGIKRGYNYFVENFESIMTFLFNMKEFQLKKGQADYLRDMIYIYRDCIFSDYIPLPNKTLLVVEKTHMGTYIDDNIFDAIDIIKSLASIDRDFHDQTLRVKENRTARAIGRLAEFYENYAKVNLSPKEGLIQSHVVASRTNFSFRAVIISLTGTHDHREIHVPWGVGLTAFRPHMLNKLQAQGMGYNEALGMLLGHVEKYNENLDRLLQELIDESPDKGLWCILQRNPSQLQGSAQRVKITKFKNPRDHTISMSILIVRAMNADFDGDALNVSIALDNYMSRMWEPLDPSFNVFDLNVPYKISGNVALPKPEVSAIARWLAA